MRENQIHIMTFLMLTMLILVSSIREKTENKQIRIDSLLQDEIKDKLENTNYKRLGISSNDHDHSENLDPNAHRLNYTDTTLTFLPKIKEKFLNHKNVSNWNISSYNDTIIPSSFPFILSLNLIDTTSTNNSDKIALINTNDKSTKSNNKQNQNSNDVNYKKDDNISSRNNKMQIDNAAKMGTTNTDIKPIGILFI